MEEHPPFTLGKFAYGFIRWPEFPLQEAGMVLITIFFILTPNQLHPTSINASLLVGTNPQKSPEDNRKDRVDKYARYFKGNRILLIPELVEAVQPKTLSFIITDIKTRRLVWIKKDTFEDLLKAAGSLAKYFFRRSFATWDVLLPFEDLTIKLASSNINPTFFRLQPEYLGKRRIKITVCNVPVQINGDVFAAFLSEYGDVEEVMKAKSTNGTAHGDYFLTMCLNRGGGAQAIPHVLEYESQVMTVVVEGRRTQCWNCIQLGHFSRSCPQKTTKPTSSPPTATTTTTITDATPNKSTKPEAGDHPNKKEEESTLVARDKKKKSPLK